MVLPEECSIDDFASHPNKPVVWEGVRNYQARNFLRQMREGDKVFIYHSSCKLIGIAMTAEPVGAGPARDSKLHREQARSYKVCRD